MQKETTGTQVIRNALPTSVLPWSTAATPVVKFQVYVIHADRFRVNTSTSCILGSDDISGIRGSLLCVLGNGIGAYSSWFQYTCGVGWWKYKHTSLSLVMLCPEVCHESWTLVAGCNKEKRPDFHQEGFVLGGWYVPWWCWIDMSQRYEAHPVMHVMNTYIRDRCPTNDCN